MRTVQEMTNKELREEIKYIASLMDDKAQAMHSAAYLADLADELAKRSFAE